MFGSMGVLTVYVNTAFSGESSLITGATTSAITGATAEKRRHERERKRHTQREGERGCVNNVCGGMPECGCQRWCRVRNNQSTPHECNCQVVWWRM